MPEEAIKDIKDVDSRSQRISGDWFDSAIKKDLPRIIKGKKIPSLDKQKDEKYEKSEKIKDN